MNPVRVPWSDASFLVYTGGLTVLNAALAALGYLAASYGHAAFAGWALLILAVLYGVAHAFKRRDRWVAAGAPGSVARPSATGRYTLNVEPRPGSL